MPATEAIASAVERLAGVAEMLLKPRATRALAKAEAEAALITSVAEIQAADLKAGARRRAELDEVRHYVNLTDTLATAKAEIEYRGAKALLAEQAVGASDPDWFHKWASYAKETSDQDIRSLWAKVLAGEIVQPGRFSLRLLHTINLLRKADAEAFARFCNYAWRDIRGDAIVIYNEASWKLLSLQRGVNNPVFFQLVDLGLVMAQTMQEELRAEQTEYLCYAGKAYSYLSWLQKKDRLRIFRFTQLGSELLELCAPVPDKEYLLTVGGECFSKVEPPPSPWPWPSIAQAQ